MKIPKGNLNRANVAMATGRAKRHVEDVLESAKKLSQDSEKKERLQESLCPCCYYLRKARMGGARITHKDCAECEREMVFSSTATDLLCIDCAKENKLCLRCGADLELKERRNPYPFQINKNQNID